MLRFRKKSVEDSIAGLQVPKHADPGNKADAQQLVETVKKHFREIQIEMQRPASKAQELNVLGHITSIATATIRYGTSVAQREGLRDLRQSSSRSKARTPAPAAKEVDSTRELRLAETLRSKVNTIADRLREFYAKVFDEREGS